MNKIEFDNAADKRGQANIFNHILRERLLGILFGITFGWGASFILTALILDGHKWEVASWTLATVSCLLGLALILTVAHMLWSNHKYLVRK
jgi:drug/metabolite transporter (DMT)-like permease